MRKKRGIAYNLLGETNDSKYQLVFIHGTGGHKHAFDLLVDELSEYTCYLIDLPGHGDSDDTGYNVDNYLNAIEDFISDMENVIIIGHSMGGALAVGICERHLKDVKAGIILDGAAKFGDLEGILDMAHQGIVDMNLMGRTFGKIEDPEVIASMQGAINEELFIKDMLIDEKIDFTADLDKVDVPLLVMTGADEILVPPSDSELICSKVKDSKLVIIPHAMHLMPFTHRKEVAGHIIRFIETL